MSDVVVSLGGVELVIERPKLGVIVRLRDAWAGDRAKFFAVGVAALVYGWPPLAKKPNDAPCSPRVLGHDVLAISDEAIDVLVTKRKLGLTEVRDAGVAVFTEWLKAIPTEEDIEAAVGNSLAQDAPSGT